jgi:trehalose/maltose hydrolase-like predicted phosphorylase
VHTWQWLLRHSRRCAESRADGTHYPGSYVAGCYNQLRTDVAGRTVVAESLVNAPNWLPLSFAAGDGPWLDATAMEILEHWQELDMRRGAHIRIAEVALGDELTVQKTVALRDSPADWMLSTLRLHLFHLLQTVSPNSIGRDIGIPAEAGSASGAAVHGHGEVILVVDDEPALREAPGCC